MCYYVNVNGLSSVYKACYKSESNYQTFWMVRWLIGLLFLCLHILLVFGELVWTVIATDGFSAIRTKPRRQAHTKKKREKWRQQRHWCWCCWCCWWISHFSSLEMCDFMSVDNGSLLLYAWCLFLSHSGERMLMQLFHIKQINKFEQIHGFKSQALTHTHKRHINTFAWNTGAYHLVSSIRNQAVQT